MAAGSLFSSFSNEIVSLLIFRIIVSIGAAMRMSTGLAMVMMIFKDKERERLGANTTTTVGLLQSQVQFLVDFWLGILAGNQFLLLRHY